MRVFKRENVRSSGRRDNVSVRDSHVNFFIDEDAIFSCPKDDASEGEPENCLMKPSAAGKSKSHVYTKNE